MKRLALVLITLLTGCGMDPLHYPDPCTNGVLDPGEQAVDCGGTCKACSAGAIKAICSDHAQNGNETDVDCGGPLCAACATGQHCHVAKDCITNACANGLCGADTCANGARDGDETDVDCGGSCVACATGHTCVAAADCASGRCTQDKCEPATCGNQQQDADETGVDCGGVCAGCAAGQACKVAGDCNSQVCTGATCQAATCTDGVRNGDETGPDCGGSTCAACPVGASCRAAGDCHTGVCASTVCQAASCSDHVQNAQETGVDCGGPDCGACPAGQGCVATADCSSGVCSQSVCQAPTCHDQVQNGNELAVDCGGSCPGCGTGTACTSASICASHLCTNGQCAAPSCTDTVQNGNETDIDCGGDTCPACSNGEHCQLAADCNSRACSGNLCQVPSCTDNAQNGNETGVDCGGPDCAACGAGQGCGSAVDCTSGICGSGVCQACGHFGQQCCPASVSANACAAGLTCENGLCTCNGQGFACGGSCCSFDQLCAHDTCVDQPDTCLAWDMNVRTTTGSTASTYPRTCLDIITANPNALDGLYLVDPNMAQQPFLVRCDMTYDGGGWTLVGYETHGTPGGGDTGVMSSLYATSGSPNDVAQSLASAFIGPMFTYSQTYTAARFNFCNPAVTTKPNKFMRFETSDELFATSQRNSLQTEIALSGFTSNDSVLAGMLTEPSSANFCRAATPTNRSGDTSWGVKGSDGNFDCGCNSGGWTGQGAYYGGTGNDFDNGTVQHCTYCSCWGGGWSGTVGDGGQKGGVNANDFYFWIR